MDDKKYASLNSLKIFLDNLKVMMNNHNTTTDSHNDIRIEVEDIAARLSALADCDDETLDQISEIVQYIKDNRELIEQITTAKVSVSDIIDNLTTNANNKPLSAAQGVVLNQLLASHTHTKSEITDMPDYADTKTLSSMLNEAYQDYVLLASYDTMCYWLLMTVKILLHILKLKISH